MHQPADTDMTTLLLTHPNFVGHDTGSGHPERPDRMRAIDRVLSHEIYAGLSRAEAPLRDDAEEAILLAHPPQHLAHIKSARRQAESGPIYIDGDTVMSPGSWEAVMRAVGAGLEGVDKVMDPASGIKNVFCQVRPPGHHAEAERAMGFCFFNSVAVAAHYAKKKYGVERVAVVDFDVHHGNGTQDIFFSDKSLFYASTHQMPLYPGTGATSEVGVGNICNAPLRAGDTGSAFEDAFKSRILPALNNFAPDLLLISAGFDAHKDDPLANLRLVEADFLWVTEQLAKVADRHCKGRIVSMLEGGYDLTALARSVAVHVKSLMDVG
jgi:acetoin utilization deacetylase AcuC-like enzyme